MKKIFLFTLLFALLVPSFSVHAQGMNGKEIYQKLQSKQTECAKLTDGDFEALGELFSAGMMGNGYEFMNGMMEQAMGTDGEKFMLIVMGKRFSGCDTKAELPAQYEKYSSLLPMMSAENFQASGSGSPLLYSKNRGFNGGFGMMGGTYGFSGFHILGGLTMLLVWTALILLVVALVKYIRNQRK